MFKCLSRVNQSFFLFFTFFMTSIAFKVHINDNWKICPPPFFILKALGAIWWTKWVQKDQNVQVCELSGSGCSKLVELCGTRLQQVRACPGRCIGTISRIRSGHRRCHRPSKWAKRAQIGPFCVICTYSEGKAIKLTNLKLSAKYAFSQAPSNLKNRLAGSRGDSRTGHSGPNCLGSL